MQRNKTITTVTMALWILITVSQASETDIAQCRGQKFWVTYGGIPAGITAGVIGLSCHVVPVLGNLVGMGLMSAGAYGVQESWRLKHRFLLAKRFYQGAEEHHRRMNLNLTEDLSQSHGNHVNFFRNMAYDWGREPNALANYLHQHVLGLCDLEKIRLHVFNHMMR